MSQINNSNEILSKITIRPLRETDDLNEITLLLNRAYKFLADMGFRYLASHQETETTKERIKKAKCFVAVLKEDPQEKIVGIISYYSPKNANGCDWYDKPEVAYFGQFGVDPDLQKSGIGSLLLDEVEKLAKKDKAEEIALDTAEGAAHLIKYYGNRGYRHVDYTKWHVTNYRSVIMSKKLN